VCKPTSRQVDRNDGPTKMRQRIAVNIAKLPDLLSRASFSAAAHLAVRMPALRADHTPRY
jgi:hypothetical protein